MTHSISKQKLDELIADEEKGYKEYMSLGLNNLAKDELKHKKYLQGIRKVMKWT